MRPVLAGSTIPCGIVDGLTNRRALLCPLPLLFRRFQHPLPLVQNPLSHPARSQLPTPRGRIFPVRTPCRRSRPGRSPPPTPAAARRSSPPVPTGTRSLQIRLATPFPHDGDRSFSFG
ncbi:unnamed protein product [Urochloa humidicola]